MSSIFKPRIRRLRAHRYVVESRSRPGIGHQVDVLRLSCGCPAGQNGMRCWHLVWALAYEDWRRQKGARP